MSMKRLATLAATVLVAVGVSASPASAAVQVNGGSGGNVTLEGNFSYGMSWGTFDVVAESCNTELSVTVAGDGSLYFPISFSQVQGYNCYISSCDSQEWGGQIVGPGDPGYAGVGEFEMLVTGCIEGSSYGWVNGLAMPIRLSINEQGLPPYVPLHQVWSLDRQLPFSSNPPYFFVKGGEYTASEELEIEQVE